MKSPQLTCEIENEEEKVQVLRMTQEGVEIEKIKFGDTCIKEIVMTGESEPQFLKESLSSQIVYEQSEQTQDLMQTLKAGETLDQIQKSYDQMLHDMSDSQLNSFTQSIDKEQSQNMLVSKSDLVKIKESFDLMKQQNEQLTEDNDKLQSQLLSVALESENS